MDNKLVQVVIAITVGIVVLGSLLVPVITEASTTEKTFTNEGYYTMDQLDTTASLTMVWNSSNPDAVTIGDETVDMSFATVNLGYTIVGSDNFAIRFTKTTNGTIIQGFGSEYFNQGSGTIVTITIENGSVSAHTNRADISGGLTTTYTYSSSAYVINPDGDGEYTYVMKNASTSAYVNGDSMIHFIGATNVSSSGTVAVYGEGTLDDGIDLETIGLRNVSTATYSTPTATYSAVSGYDDLFSLDKYEFTITYDGTSSYDATYSYFIVPAEVTAEKSEHLNTSEIGLLAVIPVLIIVALLIVAVRTFSGRD